MFPELLLLNLILGIVFGFVHRGRENYTMLLRHGAIAGLILGILLVLAIQYLIPGGADAGFGFAGVFGFFLEILAFLILFIIGVFIGDWIECSLHRKK